MGKNVLRFYYFSKKVIKIILCIKILKVINECIISRNTQNWKETLKSWMSEANHTYKPPDLWP